MDSAAYFDQRARAALRAISARSSSERLSARALPPLCPPFRPACAFGDSGSGSASLVASSTMLLASWLVSRGRFLFVRLLMVTF